MMKYALLFMLLATAAHAETHIGRPYVHDGDTIVMLGVKIRLFGIDALELRQSCSDGFSGEEGADYLRQLIDNKPVRCEQYDMDHYGRSVDICTNAKGVDINRAMVEAGHAFAYVYYSTRYVAAERAARAAGVGIFQPGRTCSPPWQWRKEHR